MIVFRKILRTYWMNDSLRKICFVFRENVHNIRFFLYQGFPHRHWQSTGQQGREGTIFSSTLPLQPAHKHWEIYLQLCMWDDYHVFLDATLVFTRLLLDEIYHLIGLTFEWLIDDAMFVLFTWWIDTRFLLQRFEIGNRWVWARIDYHPCITSESTNQVC